MATAPPPQPAAPSLTDSHFAALPKVCHQRGYYLLRLGQASASLRIEKTLFCLQPRIILGHTAFRSTPSKVLPLIQQRNTSLKKMGWLHQTDLVLFMPVIKRTLTEEYLDAALSCMAKEVDHFSRQLRANGIWEF